MSPPRDASDRPGSLARYTPDSRRWRRRVAGLAAITAPLALYATVAIISGVKTGLVYNLLIVVFALLALVLPAVAAATLLAPDSGLTRADRSGTDRSADAVETLKRRYATGEIDQAEFDRRLDDLVAVDDAGRERRTGETADRDATLDAELDSTGR